MEEVHAVKEICIETQAVSSKEAVLCVIKVQ